MTPTTELPNEAWVVALLSLPKLGPRRLTGLLDRYGAAGAWQRLRSGGVVEVDAVGSHIVDTWRQAARSISVPTQWASISDLGVAVAVRGEDGYPERLERDLDPPAVVFSLGGGASAISPGAPTVGIVGTRKCTSYGHRVAFELGAALVESGVSVVSGLAKGIDASAHRGALSSAGPRSGIPIGVVGSGLDVVYPRANAALWDDVARTGLLLSETPPGIGPEAWRFPARNRIIAALSDAVIVIESHEKGGSLITVDEAQARDIEVGAVPGPVTSNAASGTNRLLVDGATPILDVTDVHALIGYSPPTAVSAPVEGGTESEVLDALGWTPLSFEQLCSRIDMPVSMVATHVEQLIGWGVCAREGAWIERVR